MRKKTYKSRTIVNKDGTVDIRPYPVYERKKLKTIRKRFNFLAATVLLAGVAYTAHKFDEYLDQKHEAEKQELTDQKHKVKEIVVFETLKPKSPDANDVTLYQNDLLTLGCDLGKWGADGDYGFQTVIETLKIQYLNNLDLTGHADNKTRHAVQEHAQAVLSGTKEIGCKITILQSIDLASKKTGLSKAYLGATAFMESSFNATARAKTTTATGLLQFTDDAAIKAVFHHGAKYGLSGFIKEIKFLSNGRADIASSGLKKRILEIRNNPLASTLLAAETALAARKALKKRVSNKKINDTDLYIAHFMGTGGGSSFLRNLQRSPSKSGAKLYPGPAKRNKGIFYRDVKVKDKKTKKFKKEKKARSLKQIYQRFENKMTHYKKLVAHYEKQEQAKTLIATENKQLLQTKISKALAQKI